MKIPPPFGTSWILNISEEKGKRTTEKPMDAMAWHNSWEVMRTVRAVEGGAILLDGSENPAWKPVEDIWVVMFFDHYWNTGFHACQVISRNSEPSTVDIR